MPLLLGVVIIRNLRRPSEYSNYETFGVLASLLIGNFIDGG